jgi:hypothetical protein
MDSKFLIFFFEKFLIFVGVVDNIPITPPLLLRMGYIPRHQHYSPNKFNNNEKVCRDNPVLSNG